MTRDPRYSQLLEASWRRKLTGAEEAQLREWLAANPGEQQDWETEAALNQALARLPAAEVPSNFTARVMAAVEREEPGAVRPAGWQSGVWRPLLRWLPRAAVAALAIGAGLYSYHYGRLAKRKEVAESLVAVSEVSALPSPQALQDFDAIQALNTKAAPDEALLALFK